MKLRYGRAPLAVPPPGWRQRPPSSLEHQRPGSPPLWRDRQQAGAQLAERLRPWQGRPAARLVALPRGGVPVAAAIADRLHLPLCTWAVRKLAHLAAPEYAIGALAPMDVVLWDDVAVRAAGLTPLQQEQLLEAQRQELQRRRCRFGDPDPRQLAGADLLVIDDGIATGLSVRAALASLRRAEPASLVLAVPVLDRRVLPLLEPLVDQLVALAVVDHLRAVGEWYEHFEQVGDAQVLALLGQHAGPGAPPPP